MKNDTNETGSTAVLELAGGADKAEMMKKMAAAGTPGPAHKALDAFVGEWQAEVRCWMEPGGPPSVSHAAATGRWILNGHFLEEEFHGEMMGNPFTGRSLIGYDNTRQTYNSVWVSDMQTSMFTTEGKGESGNKVITLEGTMDCPASGQKDVPMKSVFRILSQDKHIFEMFNDGVKSMEITYTRK
jgi:hypothetical protein